jgi:tol-pal system protein YbgF
MLERRINGLSIENRSLNQQVAALRKDIDAAKEASHKAGQEDIASVRSTQAATANRIEQLQAELLRLSGLIEQTEHRSRRETEESLRFREEMQEQMTQLSEEVKLLQASAQTAQEVEQARKKAAEGQVDLYQQALDLIKDKKFKEAKQTLQTYIDKTPGGDRISNAHFWIGECEYNVQRYEEAILEYQKVISKFPKSNKVPDSLLKQGISFAKLGDNESAKIVLNKLLKQYPRSPQAKVAEKQLSRLR